MRVPLLSGVYSTGDGDIRAAYPVNMLPIAGANGINEGYFRPAYGVTFFSATAGADRGGVFYAGTHLRVIGESLYSVSESGGLVEYANLASLGGTTANSDYVYNQAKFSYGPDRLAIWWRGKLFYYIPNGSPAYVRVTDSDLGEALDGVWADGYFLSTDGRYVVSTEINDPMSVEILKYGSAEADPDEIVGLGRLRNEVYVFGRNTIEVLENVGGAGFPWQRVPSAQVMKGALHKLAFCEYQGTWAFVGSGRNEPPAVYIMTPGDVVKISDDEIERDLELYDTVLESVFIGGQSLLFVHTGVKTWVYNHAASSERGTKVWSKLVASNQVGAHPWPLRRMVYTPSGMIGGDVTWLFNEQATHRLGKLDESRSDQFGEVVSWELSTPFMYGGNAIVGSIDLVSLTGNSRPGKDPVIWTSYSHDGRTWSQERELSTGARGDRSKRLQWRNQGMVRNWRIQKFRGTSDSHISPIRLDVEVEPLYG